MERCVPLPMLVAPGARSGTFFYYSAPDMPTSALLGHVRERKDKERASCS